MMRNHETTIVQLPFAGFYESLYSGEIDQQEESFVEYRVDGESTDSDYEGWWPEALRLDRDKLQSILFDVTSYDIAYRKLAGFYVDAFDALAGEAFGFTKAATRQRYDCEAKETRDEAYRADSMHMTFESMDSPREYNFTTDRVYATVPLAIMYLLFRRSRAEEHETLRDVIRARHSSRSGFISYYRNDVSEWLEKPLRDWDHNELETLLIAGCRMAGFDHEDSDLALYYATIDHEGGYQAWESAVDWQAFETKRKEARAELLAQWIGQNPAAFAAWAAHHADEVNALMAADPESFQGLDFAAVSASYRCPETLDLFAGESSR